MIFDEIQEKLSEIERTSGVRILYACESGSRAWGFPSPDSDYDVRFIYVHPRNWYLGIYDNKDVIELPVNEILDISGWDLRKALRLFKNTNAPLYEWLQSGIVYRQNAAFTQELKALMPEYYLLRSGLHHYLSMAKNAFAELQGEAVRVKKYFYCLRPLLAAKWIIDRQQLPPMDFDTLRTNLADSAINSEIDTLLELKRKADEKGTIAPMPAINAFIEQQITWCSENQQEVERKETDAAPLNNLFRKYIDEA
ncbi:MAG: nucleotidyltransferase domain-containing protein [Bacteroidota bacterium]